MSKTPEEIKKGLKLCLTHGACYICPYDDMTKDCDVCRPHLVADAEAYIQQLEAQVPRWISVEERLPEDGEDVAAIIRCSEYVWYYGIAYQCNREWRDAKGIVNVTHWLPMPEHPKEE